MKSYFFFFFFENLREVSGMKGIEKVNCGVKEK